MTTKQLRISAGRSGYTVRPAHGAQWALCENGAETLLGSNIRTERDALLTALGRASERRMQRAVGKEAMLESQ